MSKRVPNEERRVSTTFAVSQNTIRKIDELATVKECSRSTVIAHAIEELWEEYFLPPTRFVETHKLSGIDDEQHTEEDL